MRIADAVRGPRIPGPVVSGSWQPFVIAEAGVNHGGDLDMAKRLIDEAKEGGADAIKFQTYKAEYLASENSPAYWDLNQEPTQSQFLLFKKYDRFWKSEFEALKRHCDLADIEFLSTPFDVESAAFLNDLMSVFKVSSSDLNNRPFIERLCGYGKPMILSTGASWMWEIEQAVSWIQGHGNSVALLHCVLNYPTMDSDANLLFISELLRKFPDVVVGYSDHTIPGDMRVLEVATLLGARVLEKHFTYDKSLPGNDHYHAMDKLDLQRFRERIASLNLLLGAGAHRSLAGEATARRNARRSLVAARDIAATAVLQPADITWKRPASGIDPREYDSVVGSRASAFIPADTVLEWRLLSG